VPNYVVEFWQLMIRNLCLAGQLLPGQIGPSYVEFWQLIIRNLCLAGHLLPGEVGPSYVEFWQLMMRNLQLVSGWPPAAWPSWSFQWPSPDMTTLSVLP
jgi:hypothetical protein